MLFSPFLFFLFAADHSVRLVKTLLDPDNLPVQFCLVAGFCASHRFRHVHILIRHHSDMAEGNVMTEYETKFSAEGKPICKLTTCRDKKVTAKQAE